MVHRIGADAQGSVHQDRGRNLVVLHPHHHLVLHRKSVRLPDSGAHGVAHRFGRRSGQKKQDPVRLGGGRRHHDLLQGTAGALHLLLTSDFYSFTGTKRKITVLMLHEVNRVIIQSDSFQFNKRENNRVNVA